MYEHAQRYIFTLKA